MTEIPLEMVMPALLAARRALQKLDEEEVPAALTRIAGTSGRRLPPPLARKLIEALDEDPWLRDKAGDADGAPELDDARPEVIASALFLRRPDGWEESLEALVADRENTLAAASQEELERQVEELRRALEVARRKAKEAARNAESARVDVERARRDSVAELEAARREGAAGVEEIRKALDRSESDRAALAVDLAQADERIGTLRQELLRARRTPAPAGEDVEPVLWSMRGPVSLARTLDQLTAATRPEAVASDERSSGGSEPAPRRRFALPVGVAPDSVAAVQWLLGWDEPTTLIVDGYNVTYLLDERRFTAGVVRERLVRELARLRRLAEGPVRVVAVFDSATADGDGEPAASSYGVEVRWAPSADEDIVALASGTDGAVVVVSTDRSVREAAEAAGAMGLWSQALVEWITRR